MSAPTPRISIVLPVLDGERFLEEALSSVVAQTTADWELIFVDDGSSDGTSQILAKRSDIRVIRHGQNQGYGAALVSAFEFAQRSGYRTIVTIDCDGQHEPQRRVAGLHIRRTVERGVAVLLQAERRELRAADPVVAVEFRCVRAGGKQAEHLRCRLRGLHG